ncbi:DUF4403 family protein [Gemmatimonas sp.]|uniref:DUF4403 family protein n=1 Tax=Gemmatimonas sp. TaxID=1962908 RepID=UPI0037C0395F
MGRVTVPPRQPQRLLIPVSVGLTDLATAAQQAAPTPLSAGTDPQKVKVSVTTVLPVAVWHFEVAKRAVRFVEKNTKWVPRKPKNWREAVKCAALPVVCLQAEIFDQAVIRSIDVTDSVLKTVERVTETEVDLPVLVEHDVALQHLALGASGDSVVVTARLGVRLALRAGVRGVSTRIAACGYGGGPTPVLEVRTAGRLRWSDTTLYFDAAPAEHLQRTWPTPCNLDVLTTASLLGLPLAAAPFKGVNIETFLGLPLIKKRVTALIEERLAVQRQGLKVRTFADAFAEELATPRALTTDSTLWLVLQPQRLHVAHPLPVDGRLRLGLGATLQPVLAFDHQPPDVRAIPTLQMIVEPDPPSDSLDVRAEARLSYRQLARVLADSLRGKKFRVLGTTLRVRDVTVTGDDSLAVFFFTLQRGRRAQGRLVATGRVVFDSLADLVRIQGIDFATGEMGAIGALAQAVPGPVRTFLEQKARVPVGTHMRLARQRLAAFCVPLAELDSLKLPGLKTAVLRGGAPNIPAPRIYSDTRDFHVITQVRTAARIEIVSMPGAGACAQGQPAR